MLFYSIVYALALIITTTLAFVVYLSNRKNPVNISFSTLLLSIVIWIISLFLFYNIHIPNSVLFLGRLNFVAASLLASLVLIFAYLFPVKTFSFNSLTIGVVVVENLSLFFVTLFTPFIAKEELISGNSRITVYGDLYWLFILHFLLYILSSIFILLQKYKKLEGREKLQVRYLIFGITLSVIFGSVTNIFVPLLTGIYDIQHFGVLAPVILAIFTGYSIVRHRLMDIRLIVVRLIVYILLLGTLGVFYTLGLAIIGGLFFPQSFSFGYLAYTAGISLFGIFTFQPLRRFFEKITARFLYRDYYDTNDLLRTLSHLLASTLDVKVLTNLVVNSLKDTMHINEISLAVLSNNKLELYGDTRGINTYTLGEEEIGFISKTDKLVSFEELEEGIVKEQFRRYDIMVALPIKTSDKFLGFLFLGQKSSGDVYYQQDLRTLEILGPELAVALQNAERYEEIQQFSQKLEAEVKAATTDLRDANEKLHVLDRQKNEFISIAAHELRAPLTAVKGYTSMILDGDAGEIPDKAKDFLNDANLSSERMVRLIGNLLNVGRIEENRLVYQMGDINLSDVASTVYKEFLQEAKLKEMELKLEIPDELKDLVYVDKDRIHEVIGNFVGNGIKYTENGKVTIALKNPTPQTVRVEVIDTGPGISSEGQQKLFQKYYRVKASATAVSGTGLGLYVSRLLVEKFGGTIGVSSEEGKGSTFWFELPLKSASTEKEEA